MTEQLPTQPFAARSLTPAEMPVITRFDLIRQVVGGWLYRLSNIVIGHGMTEGEYNRRCRWCSMQDPDTHGQDEYDCISKWDSGWICGCCSG